MEEWRDVVGLEDYFKVSNLGSVYSKRTDKILKQNTHPSGYKTIATRLGGRKSKSICMRVHRIVAEAFIENLERKPHVNHKDGDKTNNRLENLEWVTASENIIHAYANGLMISVSGLDKPQSKLTEENVKEIRGSTLTTRELAGKFNVHHSTIVRCRNKERYASLV